MRVPFQALLRRWLRDRRGGTALAMGVAAPTLALGVSAAVEYASLAARHSQLQKAVDAAALAATQQLRLANNTDSVVDASAKAVIAADAPTPDGGTTLITTEVINKRGGVRVTVSETVTSLMGKALSLPTMQLGVTATAQLSGTAKLCLLTLDPKKGKSLNLDKNSLITAGGCAIYSNSRDKSGIKAEDYAQATASLICSVGGVDQKGTATLRPSPTTDCPAIADPLAAYPRPKVGLCTNIGVKVTTTTTLYPGTYCNGIEVSGAGRVTLMPGTYVLVSGSLVVKDTATLSGQNVGFFFAGDASGLRFDPNTSISLTAPKSGEMAGLLFFEDRTVPALLPDLPLGPTGAPPPPPLGSPPMRTYRITSNNAPTLLGTIYVPAGRLVIDASRPVADRSAYTVIVAQQLELDSGPNLYLNSDYGSTDIPVPDGVGPRSGGISLTQ